MYSVFCPMLLQASVLPAALVCSSTSSRFLSRIRVHNEIVIFHLPWTKWIICSKGICSQVSMKALDQPRIYSQWTLNKYSIDSSVDTQSTLDQIYILDKSPLILSSKRYLRVSWHLSVNQVLMRPCLEWFSYPLSLNSSGSYPLSLILSRLLSPKLHILGIWP